MLRPFAPSLPNQTTHNRCLISNIISSNSMICQNTHSHLTHLTISRDATSRSFREEQLQVLGGGANATGIKFVTGGSSALDGYFAALNAMEAKNKAWLTMNQDRHVLNSNGSSTPNVTVQTTSNLPYRGRSVEEHQVPTKDRFRQLRWEILHRVEGHRLLLGQPYFPAINSDVDEEIVGELEVTNLKRRLKSNPEVAFLVFRDYDTEDTTVNALGSSPGDDFLIHTLNISVPSDEPVPRVHSESLKLVSREMQEACGAFLSLQSLGPNGKSYPPSQLKEEFSAPYVFWYSLRAHRHRISELSERHWPYLKLLESYIESCYSEIYDDVDCLLGECKIRHEYIRFLAQPGEPLVTHSRQHLRGSLAKSLVQRKDLKGAYTTFNGLDERESTGYAVQCQSFTFRDGSYALEEEWLPIAPTHQSTHDVDEEMDIRSLQTYPLRFAAEEVKAKLERVGLMCWSSRVRRFVTYSETEGTVSDRFMIDTVTYNTLHGSHGHDEGRWVPEARRRQPNIPESRGPVGDEIYAFPAVLKGFDIVRKKWFDLDVSKVTEIEWDKKAFDNLALSDAKTKDLIQALVTTQVASEKGTDIIKGKGKGLILLLHGAPGTGKTFTAEAVAELTEKPLYRVTCGDVGTKPEDVEKYLESVLNLGKIWGCVVLLDEAEVFLEQRGLADLNRNALVSVFLRVLEYYDGILILTSSRVGTFDKAFKSRIHLAIHYDNLSVPQRRKIWRNFFTRLKEIDGESIDFKDISDNLDDFARMDMNGRAIRNAITTARQLAKHRKEVVSSSHLQYVIEVASKFDDYIKNVKEGLTDAELARDEGIR